MTKVHIAAQIAEVRYELDMRRMVYPSSKKLHESVKQLHMTQMQAVLETLLWVQVNEANIREWAAAQRRELVEVKSGTEEGNGTAAGG